MSQAGLIEAAGGGTGDVGTDERVEGKGREGLLCQQDAAAGAFLHAAEDLQIAAEAALVDDVDRR